MTNIKDKKNTKTASKIESCIQRLYNQSAPLLILEAILFAITGIVMLASPVGTLTLLTFIIGGALTIFGLYRIITGLVTSRDFGYGWLDVLFGIINIVLGIVFCVNPVRSIIGVSYIFIIFFISQSIYSVIFAFRTVHAKLGHYIINLFLSIIILLLAIALLFWPMAGAVTAIILLALMLLLYSFADIYMYFEIRRLKKLITQ